MSLFTPLLPSPGLSGPPSSLPLLRSNLTVMLVISRLNLLYHMDVMLSGSTWFPLPPILSCVVMLINLRLLVTLGTIVSALMSKLEFLPLSSFLRVFLCLCAFI